MNLRRHSVIGSTPRESRPLRSGGLGSNPIGGSISDTCKGPRSARRPATQLKCVPRVGILFENLNGPVAQRSEQRTHNSLVLGSNPSGAIILMGAADVITFARKGQSGRAHQLAPVAQLDEHRNSNSDDAGSTPAWRTTFHAKNSAA